MPININAVVQEIRKHNYMAEITSWVDPAEQTRASWARRIESYNAVPEIYREAFAGFAGADVFPYTVLTPTYAGFIRPATEKLICAADRELYILEEDGVTCRTQCYPYAGIYHVEVQSVLLDSSITLQGLTKSGAPASSTFRFNSVSDELMAPILEKIRRAASGIEKPQITAHSPAEPEQFNVWKNVSYKFTSYARRSLLEGESVVSAILHPEIREKVITILGKSFYRTLAPMQAVIRTNGELIIIREGKRMGDNAKYGGIWDYIPLRKINAMSLDDKEDDLVALSIYLPDGICLSYLFEASAKPQLQSLLP